MGARRLAHFGWAGDHGFSAGAGAEIIVEPGEDGYDELWKLHADFGFEVAEKHVFTLTMEVRSGADGLCYCPGLQYSWKGVASASFQVVVDESGEFEGLAALVQMGGFYGGVVVEDPGVALPAGPMGQQHDVAADTMIVLGVQF